MAGLIDLTLCSALLLMSGIAAADDFVGRQRGVAYRLAPQTEMRNRGVVMQGADWSCGSASMATLLAEKFGATVQEESLFDLIALPLAGQPEALRRLEEKGMSAAHLRQMAEAAGFQGQGVRRALAGLLESEPLPVIARITELHPEQPRRMYEHWVVVSGIAGERVMVRDPVRGNRRMPLYAFRAAWLGEDGKGVLFRVEREFPAPASAAALVNEVPSDPPSESGLSN